MARTTDSKSATLVSRRTYSFRGMDGTIRRSVRLGSEDEIRSRLGYLEATEGVDEVRVRGSWMALYDRRVARLMLRDA